jgi:hypothetical protein
LHFVTPKPLSLGYALRRIPSEPYVIRPLAAAGLLAVLLAACSPGGGKPADSGPYAGLNREIGAWHTALESEQTICRSKVDGHGCEGFEVTCKAMQPITPEETAKGVTARVIAAMSFNGRATGKAGSAFAIFTRTGGQWTRTEAMPVNMSTCAPN